MTIPTLHVETETNPAIRTVACLSSISPVFLHTHSTLTVWVWTPLHGGVGVNKVAEIEAGIFLEELLRHQVTYSLLYNEHIK